MVGNPCKFAKRKERGNEEKKKEVTEGKIKGKWC